jgi:hypothetical protein
LIFFGYAGKSYLKKLKRDLPKEYGRSYCTPRQWLNGLPAFQEFVLRPSVRSDSKFNHVMNRGNLSIVTAYHTETKKRVIVDGFHRAVAVEI